MKLLITNDDIIKKAGFGSKESFIASDGMFYILYKTTNMINGNIYIGAHRSLCIYDNYIGSGIDSKTVQPSHRGNMTKFKNEVIQYGFKNFKRENLLFYSCQEDVFKAEAIVVDGDLIKFDNILNDCEGGNKPPVRWGDKNGNYGNKWSENKKRELGEYFKENRNFNGYLNPNAKKCSLLNIYTNEIINFNCIDEAEKFLKLSKTTISTMITRNKFHVFRKMYFCKIGGITESELQDIYNNIILNKPIYKHKIKFINGNN